MALAHYQGYVENVSTGKALEGAVIRVYSYPGNVLQSTFADASSTPKPVVSSDSNGGFDFYIADGSYDIEYVYNGDVLERLVNVPIFNPANLAASGGSALVGFLQAGTGAIARTLQAKGRDFIDRRDYATLQQAVNAASASTRALYLGDEDFTVTSTIALPNTDIVIYGPGSAALSITFTGTGGLFSGPNLSSTTNIDIGGFTAVAGAPDCGVPVYLQYTTSTGIDIRAANIFDVVVDGDSTNYWTGGFNINNARNSIFSDCYVHGPTDNLSKTQYGFLIAGQATDIKVDNCQVVSVGTGVQIIGEAEGTLLSNFVAVDVNIGVSKIHSGGSEPWIAMSNWHINCRQKGFYLENVLQTTIGNGLLYCQNGTGAWIGIHIAPASSVNQDVQIDALIDAQLAGGGVSSTTGIKIDAGTGINARLKMRSLSIGANIASGVINSIIEIDPNSVTTLVTGAGAYAATNRITSNIPGQGYGLPSVSGPFNPDDSTNASKEVQSYGFGRDTTGAVKQTGGVRMVAEDNNFVNARTEIMARRGDALVRGLVLFGTGTPEGAVTAPVGALYTRSDGGVSTTLYVKTSGTGNTGWTAK